MATKQHPLGSDEKRLEYNLRPKSDQKGDKDTHIMDTNIPNKAQEKTGRSVHKPCNVFNITDIKTVRGNGRYGHTFCRTCEWVAGCVRTVGGAPPPPLPPPPTRPPAPRLSTMPIRPPSPCRHHHNFNHNMTTPSYVSHVSSNIQFKLLLTSFQETGFSQKYI